MHACMLETYFKKKLSSLDYYVTVFKWHDSKEFIAVFHGVRNETTMSLQPIFFYIRWSFSEGRIKTIPVEVNLRIQLIAAVYDGLLMKQQT